MELMADRPYLAGHAVWSFTDYATEHRKRFRRQPGLFDAWRRPKMAAELFRARYAEEPFVSLFVTGAAGDKKLHIFSNCDQVQLTIDDNPTIGLMGGPHNIMDLEDGFTAANAEAARGGVTVRNELKAWDGATTVAITIDEADARPGQTVAVDLMIFDEGETPVRDWNGHVEVEVDGDARLFPYTDAGEVLMARGEGRTYLQLGRSGGEVKILATADGLEPGSMKFSPRR